MTHITYLFESCCWRRFKTQAESEAGTMEISTSSDYCKTFRIAVRDQKDGICDFFQADWCYMHEERQRRRKKNAGNAHLPQRVTCPPPNTSQGRITLGLEIHHWAITTEIAHYQWCIVKDRKTTNRSISYIDISSITQIDKSASLAAVNVIYVPDINIK